MPTRTLKVKSSLPIALEHRLVNHWGYAVEKRMYLNGNDNYILFKKTYISDKKDDGVKRTIRANNVVPLNLTNAKDFDLTKFQKAALERRCDNIVEFFPDPYSVPKAVRARLTIIQQHLKPAECEFVQHYMNENFPVELDPV